MLLVDILCRRFDVHVELYYFFICAGAYVVHSNYKYLYIFGHVRYKYIMVV